MIIKQERDESMLIPFLFSMKEVLPEISLTDGYQRESKL